ncbi:U11/U12 small nuclear ribonucleoprotein 25 kDa protein isoform X2 [Protopterus annectens]|uniref:U11/U12 small nuclear ribonucleoprotein 25 kDa protein isoform X2 n=1 Tax=Protopterus annectens TaxID=7888 RepID=UPI001CF9E400|nr:U11/U12 small nuclear ribonucleoprotein 25 kDa protein isoform X2 [Protopterus annectens]
MEKRSSEETATVINSLKIKEEHATVKIKEENVEEKKEEEETVTKEEENEEDEEELPHAEAMDIFEEGLAMIVQDPLLCDLPIQVTLEEVNSQIALEYGQAMTVRVCKGDGEIMPVVVVQNATVLDLKKAIQRYVQLKQQREGGIQHISCYGIKNRDEVTFVKKLRRK